MSRVEIRESEESVDTPKLLSFPGGIPPDLGNDVLEDDEDAGGWRVVFGEVRKKEVGIEQIVDSSEKVKFTPMSMPDASKVNAFQYVVGLYDPHTNSLTVSKCSGGVTPLSRTVTQQQRGDEQDRRSAESTKSMNAELLSSSKYEKRTSLVNDFGNKKSKKVIRESKLNQNIIEASASSSDLVLRSAAKRAIKDGLQVPKDDDNPRPSSKRRKTK